MTENKGDLISREALLEAFSNSKHIKETTSGLDVMEMLAIKEVVDNAPTVPLPDFKAGYKQAILDGQTNFSRPKGEWIVDKYGMYHCNYCMKEKQQLFHNFCSNCGADMRGKEE